MADTKMPVGEFLSKYRTAYPQFAWTDDKTLLDKVLKDYPETADRLDLPQPVMTPEDWVGPKPTKQIREIAGGEDYLKLRKSGRRGGAEAVADIISFDSVPVLADVLDWRRAKAAADTLGRLNNQQAATDEELVNLNNYMTVQKRLSDTSMPGKVVDVVSSSVRFGLEIVGATLATPISGGGSLAGVAGAKGATKVATKLALASANRQARVAASSAFAKKYIASALPGLSEKTLSLAAKTAGWGAQSAVTGLALSANPVMWAKSLTGAQTHRISNILQGKEDPSSTEALLAGWTDTAVELVSEFSGQAIASGIGAAASTATAQKMYGQTIGKMIDAASGPMATTVKNRLAGGVLNRVLLNKGLTGSAAKLSDTLATYGINSTLEEMGEERLGDFMRGLFGLEGDGPGFVNAMSNVLKSVTDMEQMGVEVIAFTIPGLAARKGPAALQFVKDKWSPPNANQQMAVNQIKLSQVLWDGMIQRNATKPLQEQIEQVKAVLGETSVTATKLAKGKIKTTAQLRDALLEDAANPVVTNAPYEPDAKLDDATNAARATIAQDVNTAMNNARSQTAAGTAARLNDLFVADQVDLWQEFSPANPMPLLLDRIGYQVSRESLDPQQDWSLMEDSDQIKPVLEYLARRGVDNPLVRAHAAVRVADELARQADVLAATAKLKAKQDAEMEQTRQDMRDDLDTPPADEATVPPAGSGNQEFTRLKDVKPGGSPVGVPPVVTPPAPKTPVVPPTTSGVPPTPAAPDIKLPPVETTPASNPGRPRTTSMGATNLTLNDAMVPGPREGNRAVDAADVAAATPVIGQTIRPAGRAFMEFQKTFDEQLHELSIKNVTPSFIFQRLGSVAASPALMASAMNVNGEVFARTVPQDPNQPDWWGLDRIGQARIELGPNSKLSDIIHEMMHITLPLLPYTTLRSVAGWLKHYHGVTLDLNALRDPATWRTPVPTMTRANGTAFTAEELYVQLGLKWLTAVGNDAKTRAVVKATLAEPISTRKRNIEFEFTDPKTGKVELRTISRYLEGLGIPDELMQVYEKTLFPVADAIGKLNDPARGTKDKLARFLPAGKFFGEKQTRFDIDDTTLINDFMDLFLPMHGATKGFSTEELGNLAQMTDALAKQITDAFRATLPEKSSDLSQNEAARLGATAASLWALISTNLAEAYQRDLTDRSEVVSWLTEQIKVSMFPRKELEVGGGRTEYQRLLLQDLIPVQAFSYLMKLREDLASRAPGETQQDGAPDDDGAAPRAFKTLSGGYLEQNDSTFIRGIAEELADATLPDLQKVSELLLSDDMFLSEVASNFLDYSARGQRWNDTSLVNVYGLESAITDERTKEIIALAEVEGARAPTLFPAVTSQDLAAMDDATRNHYWEAVARQFRLYIASDGFSKLVLKQMKGYRSTKPDAAVMDLWQPGAPNLPSVMNILQMDLDELYAALADISSRWVAPVPEGQMPKTTTATITTIDRINYRIEQLIKAKTIEVMFTPAAPVVEATDVPPQPVPEEEPPAPPAPRTTSAEVRAKGYVNIAREALTAMGFKDAVDRGDIMILGKNDSPMEGSLFSVPFENQADKNDYEDALQELENVSYLLGPWLLELDGAPIVDDSPLSDKKIRDLLISASMGTLQSLKDALGPNYYQDVLRAPTFTRGPYFITSLPVQLERLVSASQVFKRLVFDRVQSNSRLGYVQIDQASKRYQEGLASTESEFIGEENDVQSHFAHVFFYEKGKEILRENYFGGGSFSPADTSIPSRWKNLPDWMLERLLIGDHPVHLAGGHLTKAESSAWLAAISEINSVSWDHEDLRVGRVRYVDELSRTPFQFLTEFWFANHPDNPKKDAPLAVRMKWRPSTRDFRLNAAALVESAQSANDRMRHDWAMNQLKSDMGKRFSEVRDDYVPAILEAGIPTPGQVRDPGVPPRHQVYLKDIYHSLIVEDFTNGANSSPATLLEHWKTRNFAIKEAEAAEKRRLEALGEDGFPPSPWTTPPNIRHIESVAEQKKLGLEKYEVCCYRDWQIQAHRNGQAFFYEVNGTSLIKLHPNGETFFEFQKDQHVSHGNGDPSSEDVIAVAQWKASWKKQQQQLNSLSFRMNADGTALPPNPLGFFHPPTGKIALYAENIADEAVKNDVSFSAMLYAVLLHEAGAHKGMKNLVGTEDYQAIVDRIKSFSKSKTSTIANKLYRKVAARIEGITADVRDDELVGYFVEEAALAEARGDLEAEDATLWQRISAAIADAVNNFLAALGWTAKKLTPAQILVVAKAAMANELVMPGAKEITPAPPADMIPGVVIGNLSDMSDLVEGEFNPGSHTFLEVTTGSIPTRLTIVGARSTPNVSNPNNRLLRVAPEARIPQDAAFKKLQALRSNLEFALDTWMEDATITEHEEAMIQAVHSFLAYDGYASTKFKARYSQLLEIIGESLASVPRTPATEDMTLEKALEFTEVNKRNPYFAYAAVMRAVKISADKGRIERNSSDLRDLVPGAGTGNAAKVRTGDIGVKSQATMSKFLTKLFGDATTYKSQPAALQAQVAQSLWDKYLAGPEYDAGMPAHKTLAKAIKYFFGTSNTLGPNAAQLTSTVTLTNLLYQKLATRATALHAKKKRTPAENQALREITADIQDIMENYVVPTSQSLGRAVDSYKYLYDTPAFLLARVSLSALRRAREQALNDNPELAATFHNIVASMAEDVTLDIAEQKKANENILAEYEALLKERDRLGHAIKNWSKQDDAVKRLREEMAKQGVVPGRRGRQPGTPETVEVPDGGAIATISGVFNNNIVNRFMSHLDPNAVWNELMGSTRNADTVSGPAEDIPGAIAEIARVFASETAKSPNTPAAVKATAIRELVNLMRSVNPGIAGVSARATEIVDRWDASVRAEAIAETTMTAARFNFTAEEFAQMTGFKEISEAQKTEIASLLGQVGTLGANVRELTDRNTELIASLATANEALAREATEENKAETLAQTIADMTQELAAVRTLANEYLNEITALNARLAEVVPTPAAAREVADRAIQIVAANPVNLLPAYIGDDARFNSVPDARFVLTYLSGATEQEIARIDAASILLATRIVNSTKAPSPRDPATSEMVSMLARAIKVRLPQAAKSTKYTIYEIIQMAYEQRDEANAIFSSAIAEVLTKLGIPVESLHTAFLDEAMPRDKEGRAIVTFDKLRDLVPENLQPQFDSLIHVFNLAGMALNRSSTGNLELTPATEMGNVLIPDLRITDAVNTTLKEMNLKVRDLVPLSLPMKQAAMEAIIHKIIVNTGLNTSSALILEGRIHMILDEKIKKAKESKLNELVRSGERMRNVQFLKDEGGWVGRMITLIRTGMLDPNLGDPKSREAWFNEFAIRFKLPALASNSAAAEELRQMAEEVGDRTHTQYSNLARVLAFGDDVSDLSPEDAQMVNLENEMEAEHHLYQLYLHSEEHRNTMDRIGRILEKTQGIGWVKMATSVFYANALSGFSTQELNFISTMTNSVATLHASGMASLLAARRNGGDTSAAWRAYFEGFRVAWDQLKIGLFDLFPQAVKQGRLAGAPIAANQGLGRGMANTLEHAPFTEKFGSDSILRHVDNLKYVMRSMVGVDFAFSRATGMANLHRSFILDANSRGLSEKATNLWIAAHGFGIYGYDMTKEADVERLAVDVAAIDNLPEKTRTEFKMRLDINAAVHADARALGLVPGSFDYHYWVEETLYNLLDKDIRDENRIMAGRATYNVMSIDPLFSPGHRWLADISKKIIDAKVEHPWMTTIFPFVSIITNVVNTGLDWFPITGYAHLRVARTQAALTEAKIASGDTDQIAEDAYTQAHVDYLQAQVITGSVLLAGIGLMAASAMFGDPDDPWLEITGGGPANLRLKNQLREVGYQEYTIKIGGTRFNYQMSPLAVPLVTLGSYMDVIRYGNADGSEASMPLYHAMVRSLGATADQSYMTNLSDLFSALSSPNRDQAAEEVGKILTRNASTLFVPNAARQISRLFNPTLYEKPDGLYQTVMREIPCPIPLTSAKPRLNALGEPILLGQSSIVTSVLGIVRPEPMKQLGRLMSFDTQPADSVWSYVARNRLLIPMPTRTTTLNSVPMTADELYQYTQIRGDVMRTWLEHRIESGQWSEMTRDAMQADLNLISRKAGSLAKAAMLANDFTQPIPPPPEPREAADEEI